MSVQDVKDKVRGVIESWYPGDRQKTDHVVDDVAMALGLNETRHRVRVTESDLTVEHPVHERLGGTLLDCRVFDWLRALPSAPQPPGDYWLTIEDRSTPDSSPFPGVQYMAQTRLHFLWTRIGEDRCSLCGTEREDLSSYTAANGEPMWVCAGCLELGK